MTRRIIITTILLTALLSHSVHAEETGLLNSTAPADSQRYAVNPNYEFEYTKPASFDFLRSVPDDYVKFYHRAFRMENLPEIALITVSTGLMIAYDQQILDDTQKFGRRLGIGNGDNTKAFIKIGKYSIFRGPTDIGSAMYFIGDGWTHLSITAGFLAEGLISNDYRALRTSSQLAEGLVSVAFATQVLKHITGRQSPFTSDRDGGRWVFFPDQIEYHKKVADYDAFPSGHIATATMTATVIMDNYPEYASIIKPVSYTLIGLLSFQMVNNGVHWVSDYPLGIGIGYVFAKVITEHNHKVVSKNSSKADNNFNIRPIINADGSPMLTLEYIYR